jgi:hypothetical protein
MWDKTQLEGLSRDALRGRALALRDQLNIADSIPGAPASIIEYVYLTVSPSCDRHAFSFLISVGGSSHINRHQSLCACKRMRVLRWGAS